MTTLPSTKQEQRSALMYVSRPWAAAVGLLIIGIGLAFILWGNGGLLR